MGKFLDMMLGKLFDSLIADGSRVIQKAAETKEARNDTYNMLDAYGCAVYHKGKLVRKSYYNQTPKSTKTHKGWRKHSIESDTGRGYLDEFFKEYRPKGIIVLVCVNAIYYTNILEAGAQGSKPPGQPDIKKRYRIISQILYKMEDLQRKYKGSTVSRTRAIEINKF